MLCRKTGTWAQVGEGGSFGKPALGLYKSHTVPQETVTSRTVTMMTLLTRMGDPVVMA